jgi:hypothetical protein
LSLHTDRELWPNASDLIWRRTCRAAERRARALGAWPLRSPAYPLRIEALASVSYPLAREPILTRRANLNPVADYPIGIGIMF